MVCTVLYCIGIVFWCHLWWRFEQVRYSQVGTHTDRGQWPPGQQQDPGWHSFYPGHPDTGTSRHRLLSAGSRKEWQGNNLNRRVSLSEVVSETHHCWLDNARPARLGERQRKCWCRQELFDRKYQDVKHITWHPPLSHTLLTGQLISHCKIGKVYYIVIQDMLEYTFNFM